ncbi:MAG TPA: hypothetical protein VK395_19925 [Gemmataceae bacterium]|nr:hypothetical protein [Gemmataceae bacterium]
MLTTLVLLASLPLTPARSGELTLSNVRTTYGPLGAARTSNKISPGDVLVLCFDIEGFKTDAAGKAQYSIGMEVLNSKGKVLLKQEPTELEAPVAPGENRLPACARLDVGMEQPPGEYQVRLTVADRAAKTSKEVTRTYELLPKSFALVRLAITNDAQGQIPVGKVTKGRSAWISFAAVGFARDQLTGQPNVAVTMRVLNEDGRSALAQSPSGAITGDVPQKLLAIPLQFELELNQLGNFTIELKATDKIAGKTATLSVPVKVGKSN